MDYENDHKIEVMLSKKAGGESTTRLDKRRLEAIL